MKSAEDKDEGIETLIREKTMVEILLRKYGFGSWTRPDEVESLGLLFHLHIMDSCSGGASEICCF